MREAKSSGGLSRGRFRNDCAHKSWVQTLNHFSYIHQELEDQNKCGPPVHRDMTRAQIQKDSQAVLAIVRWLKEINPFDSTRDGKTLVSFSTGFSSSSEDSVNPEKAEEIGRAMQIEMDGKSVLDTMQTKYKVKSLATLRSGPKLNGEKIAVDSVRLFNRLIIISEREIKTKEALMFELTPTPMLLFDKNQMMRKPDKAALSRLLKTFVEPIEQPQCLSLVIDGGWLLHNVKWEASLTWNEIAGNYLRYVKTLGSQHARITVVFDGYAKSTKDHDHLRRTKHACCDIQIRPHLPSFVSRGKILDIKNNKIQLKNLLAETFSINDIKVQKCSDDADTRIAQEALDEAKESPVEVRTEDTDIFVLLVHHIAQHSVFITTSKNVSYEVRKIHECIPEKYRKYLLFLHSFSGCDTVSAIYGFSKQSVLRKLCQSERCEKSMEVFLNVDAHKEEIITSGCEIFKILFNGRSEKDLGDLRFEAFSKRAAAGKISPEKLPPTTGAASQHSLRAYLQCRDWLLLKTPSLDVLEYGWTLGELGYAPVPSTEPIAPNYLLKCITCNCEGDCSTRRCCCKKQGVKCISACGTCHGDCKNTTQIDGKVVEGDGDVEL